MAPFSMDLRQRVARAWDASGDAEEVAATCGVSRAFEHRLIQRRRETGSLTRGRQTKFRARVLAGQEQRLALLITAQPDITLAELRDALPTTAALSTLWHPGTLGLSTLAPGTLAPSTLAPGTLAPGTLAPGTLAPWHRGTVAPWHPF